MKYLALLLAAALVVGVATAVIAQGEDSAKNDDDTKAAVQAANAWLALVDKGQYKKSWSEAASYFRSRVTAGSWESQLKAVRAPLGAVVSRKLKSAQFAKSLPGAPDGEYVVIQFDTSFAKKAEAVETITPMKDKGVWRVSGYFIK